MTASTYDHATTSKLMLKTGAQALMSDAEWLLRLADQETYDSQFWGHMLVEMRQTLRVMENAHNQLLYEGE